MATFRAASPAVPAILALLAGTAGARAQLFRPLGTNPPDTQSSMDMTFPNGLGAVGSSSTPTPPYRVHGYVVRTDSAGNVIGTATISAPGDVHLGAASRSGSILFGQVGAQPASCDPATGLV